MLGTGQSAWRAEPRYVHQTGRKQVALLVARRVIYKILGLLSAASGFFWRRRCTSSSCVALKDPRWLCIA